ncbi:MAG: DNA gyrase inhibitor YacG [Nitrospirae bacterium]|nr:DNA gyrase inhibitor YacG [Nitrospirota bacterium]
MQVRCPVCKKKTTWEENPYKPFCSERCKLTDLGRWATEEYRVPGERTDDSTDKIPEKRDDE